jgi:hypothetical protein
VIGSLVFCLNGGVLPIRGAWNPKFKEQFETNHKDKIAALRKSLDSLLVESCKDNKAMQGVLKAIE